MKKPRAKKGAIGARSRSKNESQRSSFSVRSRQAFTVKFPPDWSEFISCLCSHRVRFLVVGAHALAANGRPRARPMSRQSAIKSGADHGPAPRGQAL